MKPDRGIDVVLVGRERQGDENLALRYLASALLGGGHRPVIIPINGPGDLRRVAMEVMRRSPALVGVSMPDGDAAIDALALVRALRHAGYDGHVTGGGSLATLSRHALLGRHPGLDSIVRLDGEVPVVDLANRLASGRDLSGVPGLTTRRGDGEPAPVTDPLPFSIRPMRGELPVIMGAPVARMIASRGCPGRCPYCGPAALQKQSLDEGIAGGSSRGQLGRLGVGGTRRRDVDDIADEMGDLFHGMGVRYFHFLDDNLLPPREADALEWLASLRRALAGRRMGRIALALQLPASTATRRVIDALQDLGLVRVMLGVEALDDGDLEALRRGQGAARLLASVDEFSRRGIVTMFNCLLLHPDSSPQSVELELRALRDVRSTLFDALCVNVHNGSDLWRRLLHEGRLDGDLLAWRFTSPSPVVRRLRAAMLRLRLLSVGRYDATTYAHDLAIGLAVARRLELPSASPRLEARLQGLIPACNDIKLHAWSEALSMAALEMPDHERQVLLDALIEQVRRRTRVLMERLHTVEKELESGGRTSPGSFLLRSCLTAGFAFCLSTTLSGCYETHGRSGARDAAVEPGVDLSADDPRLEDPPPDPAPDGCEEPGPDLLQDAYEWREWDGECSDEVRWIQQYEIEDFLQKQWECHRCGIPWTYDCTYVVLDEAGRAVDVRLASWRPDEELPPAVVSCYLEALEGHVFPCLAGEEIEWGCPHTLI